MFLGRERPEEQPELGGRRGEARNWRAHVEKVAGVGWGRGWSPGPGLGAGRLWAFLRQEPGEGASGDR